LHQPVLLLLICTFAIPEVLEKPQPYDSTFGCLGACASSAIPPPPNSEMGPLEVVALSFAQTNIPPLAFKLPDGVGL